MARKHRRKRRNNKGLRLCLAVCAIALVLMIGAVGSRFMENKMSAKVQNAGRQMTAHTSEESTAHVYMNDQWYRKKNMETMLLIGIDDYGTIAGSNSYNNTNQADFMMLIARDTETGESAAIHVNRDTMADITMLGVTGEAAGVQHAQLALAYNYGNGQHASSKNAADAVSNLLYGTQIDHYLTVTMDAIPILNDWAGGVTVEVLDDMTSADSALVLGSEIKLEGKQALTYIRARMGLDDSTNINRMERQRQYASAWVKAAQDQLKDQDAVTQLIMQMSDYHYSDCTAEELAELAGWMGENETIPIHELPGESVKGERFMEFYADDPGIQQLVLELFYELV